MKMIKRLGILFVTTLIVLSGLLVQECFAAGNNKLPPAPTEGIPSKNLTSGEGSTSSFDFNIESTQYLMSGNSSIELISSSKVRVSGNTKSYSSVDKITVNLYLQRWDDSKEQWVDVLSVGGASNYNSSVVSNSKEVGVSSGYYYRTRAQHIVSNSGVLEQSNSMSSYIYAD